MACRPRRPAQRPLSFVLLLLLLAPLAPPFDPLPPAAAQPTPQYTDASNGLPVSALWVSQPRLFDLDEDGTGDVTILGPRKGEGDRSLHVFKWGGSSWSNRSAEEGTTALSHASYGGYDFGDLDNDGDWDVGIGSHGADQVDAFLRLPGNAWLQSSLGLQASEDAYAVDIGDYNSDGNLDLLVGGFWGMDLHAYAGNGQGQWLDQSSGLERGMMSNIGGYFVDVNNDGHLDLVANLKGGSWVYLGDGSGGWTNSSAGLPAQDYGVMPGHGDFNNDGFVDLAFSVGGQTYAFAGDGSGQWVDRSVGLPAYQYKSLLLADMNNDKFDDFVGLTDNGDVEMYLATGNGGWLRAQTSVMRGNARGWRLGVGDFDHNGHLDIVAGFGTEETQGSVKVWRETTAATGLAATLLYPDGREQFHPGSVHFVRWLSEIPASTGTRWATLELSTDGSDGPWTTVATNLPDTGIYQWTVPDARSSNSYLRLTITDGLNSAGDYSDGAFGIGTAGSVNDHPEIEVTRPADDDEADTTYHLAWDASDGDDDEITIDLYHDNDTDPDNGRELIAADLANDGGYDWDLSEVASGDYHIYGIADDNNGSRVGDYAAGRVLVRHPPPNRSPELNLTAPARAGEAADSAYTITWNASDPDDDDLSIVLFYDDDTDPDNGRERIASGLSNSGRYDWESYYVTEGAYYLCGEASDGHNTTLACSDYQLAIEHPDRPPELEVLTPTDGQRLTDGVTVRWRARDPDGDAVTVALAWVVLGTLESVGVEAGLSAVGVWYWNTAELAAGHYQLLVAARAGLRLTWRNVSIEVVHPAPSLTATALAVVPARPAAGDLVRLQLVVRNDGDVDGSGTVLWTVDDATLGVTLVDLAAGEERLVEQVWIAIAGEHTVAGALGETRAEAVVTVAAAAAGNDQTLRWQWLVVGVTLLAGTTAAGAIWWFNRVARSRW